jgi:hypothetical protein
VDTLWTAEAHSLQDGETEALRIGGVETDVGDLQVILDGQHLLTDDDRVGQAKTAHVAGESGEGLPRQDEQLEAVARARSGGGLQQEVDALALRVANRWSVAGVVAEQGVVGAV